MTNATPNLPSKPTLGNNNQQEADEEEFEAFAEHQDPLDIAAATWVVRKRNGLSSTEEAELQDWLNADNRHGPALEEMETTMDEVHRFPDDDVAQLKASLPVNQKAQSNPHEWFIVSADLFRPLVSNSATAILMLALIGGGWLGWNHWQSMLLFEQNYATLRGQQLKAALPDTPDYNAALRSTLQLDTDTQVRVRLYRDRREVYLTNGQALFDVFSDSQRPFHVYVDSLRITVVGTRFSVRKTDTGLNAGHTVVSVREGQVRVENVHSHGTPVELTAGQAVSAHGQAQIGSVEVVGVDSIATWQDGRLNFNQTPLREAIAEFERYGQTNLIVNDPTVGLMPVGGSYSIDHLSNFVQNLPQVLPVRLQREGNITRVMPK